MDTDLTSNDNFIPVFLVISCHLSSVLLVCLTQSMFVHISVYLPAFYFCIDYVMVFR